MIKVTDKNRLSMIFPELCKEWNYEKNGDLKPDNISVGSGKKVWWICNNGHEWDTVIKVRKGSGCPYCSGKRATDKNRLLNKFPEIAEEFDHEKNIGLHLENICYAGRKKVWWKCKYGHQYQMRVSDRTRGSGCPYCSRRRVSDKNRISITNPELCEEWDKDKNGDLKIDGLSCCNDKKVWWKCKKCQFEWKTTCHIRHIGHGCPNCAGKVVRSDNCLSAKNPKLAKEWDYKKNKKTPDEVMSNSDIKYWWICSKGHEWESNISNRSNGNDCPYCFSHTLCKDNCLEAKNPHLATEWHSTKNGSLTPKDVFPNSSLKVWWKCRRCNHEWMATLQARSLQGHGCPKCNKIELKDGSLFDSMPEVYLYLKLKSRGFIIEKNKEYGSGLGKRRCDFYLPQSNTYIEVTSYNKSSKGMVKKLWDKYYKNILKKKSYVENILGAKFKFIQINLSRFQIHIVRKNMA